MQQAEVFFNTGLSIVNLYNWHGKIIKQVTKILLTHFNFLNYILFTIFHD